MLRMVSKLLNHHAEKISITMRNCAYESDSRSIEAPDVVVVGGVVTFASWGGLARLCITCMRVGIARLLNEPEILGILTPNEIRETSHAPWSRNGKKYLSTTLQ